MSTHMTRRRAVAVTAAALLLGLLPAACGRKGNLKPPAGEESQYPRTYPTPEPYPTPPEETAPEEIAPEEPAPEEPEQQ